MVTPVETAIQGAGAPINFARGAVGEDKNALRLVLVYVGIVRESSPAVKITERRALSVAVLGPEPALAEESVPRESRLQSRRLTPAPDTDLITDRLVGFFLEPARANCQAAEGARDAGTDPRG